MHNLRAGQTFVNKETEGIPSHLWFILSDPSKDPGRIVMANLSTLRGPCRDTTCIVHPGEHGFVSRDSVVAYAEARITSAKALSAAFRAGLLSSSRDLSEPLLSRIRSGAVESPFTPRECVDLLHRQGVA